MTTAVASGTADLPTDLGACYFVCWSVKYIHIYIYLLKYTVLTVTAFAVALQPHAIFQKTFFHKIAPLGLLKGYPPITNNKLFLMAVTVVIPRTLKLF